MPKKEPLFPHVPKSKSRQTDIESFRFEALFIERRAGFITMVGAATVKSVNLPDWSLDYIQYPPGEMTRYRNVLQQARANIVKVTNTRIYFSQQ